jgi:predicted RecA/RadA family phage recombinase
MQTSNKVSFWRLASIVMVLSLVLAACGAKATPAPTEAPTAAPTEAPTAAPAVTTVIQDFESSPTVYDGNGATASVGDVAYNGAGSLKSMSDTGEWHTVGVEFSAPVDASQYLALCFFVFDTTAFNDGKANNTVGVKLYDASGASVERYTDNEGVGDNLKTKKDQWVPMCMNLVSFTEIDQTQISKIEFTMYWAGAYYFDDITLLAQGDELVVKEQPAPVEAAPDVVAQDFESEGENFYSDYQADVSRDTEVFHSGAASLKAFSEAGEWHAFGAYPATRPFDASKHTKVCFWIQDMTTNNNGGADNTVGVKLFDASGANQELWTDNALGGVNPKTVNGEFVQMCLNLDAFSDIDLTQVDKIQFALYWAGTYYVDDIEFIGSGASAAATEPVVAQDFESEGENFYSDYQADVSRDTEVFHGGAASLKAFSDAGEWHAFGAYPATRPFDASGFGKVCFWIQDMTTNNNGGADNTVGVKLFDASGANQELWTDNALGGENPKTVNGEFVQMCLNLDAFSDIDLTQLDKVQFALYWAGTYYVDDIEFLP